MSNNRNEQAERIYLAKTDLEAARTTLQMTAGYFNLDTVNLTKADKMVIGNSAEAIGIMLNVVDDYMFKALDMLNEEG